MKFSSTKSLCLANHFLDAMYLVPVAKSYSKYLAGHQFSGSYYIWGVAQLKDSDMRIFMYNVKEACKLLAWQQTSSVQHTVNKFLQNLLRDDIVSFVGR